MFICFQKLKNILLIFYNKKKAIFLLEYPLIFYFNVFIIIFTFCYIAVPLYQIFCQNNTSSFISWRLICYFFSFDVSLSFNSIFLIYLYYIDIYYIKLELYLYYFINQNNSFLENPFILYRIPFDVSFVIPERLPINIEASFPCELLPGDVSTIFCTISNKTEHAIVFSSIYSVLPEAVTPFISKIQCFCFEQQIIPPYSSIKFPILFKVDQDIPLKFFKNNEDVLKLIYNLSIIK